MSQPINIEIQNPSFQQGMTGWNFSGGGGVETAPDGLPAAYFGSGSTISQKLSVSPAALQEYQPGYTREGIYGLKFSVLNYFTAYPGYYTAEISFGTQELCETSGWGMRTFTEVYLVGPGPGYIVINQALPGGGPVQGQNNLVIAFSNPGWPLWIRDVSLTFTPSN